MKQIARVDLRHGSQVTIEKGKTDIQLAVRKPNQTTKVRFTRDELIVLTHQLVEWITGSEVELPS